MVLVMLFERPAAPCEAAYARLTNLGASSCAQAQFDLDDNAVRYALVLIWIKWRQGPPWVARNGPLRAVIGPIAQTKRSANGVVCLACEERVAIIENMWPALVFRVFRSLFATW